jgi:hypothetical protein
MIRTDLFKSTQNVGIKLSKEAYVAMRKELFDRKLSMQEVFEEFVNLVAAHDKKTEKILNDLAYTKLKLKLDGIKKTVVSRQISELDKDLLYDLIDAKLSEDIDVEDGDEHEE